MAQVRLPPVVSKAELRQANAWIGCCRTSHLHFDGCDNVLVVAHGSKDVILFSPWQISDLYPQAGKHEERWKSAAVCAPICDTPHTHKAIRSLTRPLA